MVINHRKFAILAKPTFGLAKSVFQHNKTKVIIFGSRPRGEKARPLQDHCKTIERPMQDHWTARLQSQARPQSQERPQT